jgi:hypothetical protein
MGDFNSCNDVLAGGERYAGSGELAQNQKDEVRAGQVVCLRSERVDPRHALDSAIVRHPLREGEHWGQVLLDVFNLGNTVPAFGVLG